MHLIYSFNKNEIFKFLFLLLVSLVLYLFFLIGGDYHLIVLFALLLSIVNLVRFKNSTYFFYMLFFLMMFPFDFLLSFFVNTPLFYVYRIENIGLVFLLFLFFQIALFFAKKPKEQISFEKVSFINSNKYVVYTLIIILFCGVLYIQGSNIFLSDIGSYSTYQENLKQMSGFNEYLVIFAIFVFLFKKDYLQKLAFNLVLSFFLFKLITYGFRVQSILVALLIFFSLFQKGISYQYNFALVAIGFVLMLIFGFLKEGSDLSDIEPVELLIDGRNGYLQSHQHGVLSSSTVIIDVYSSDNDLMDKFLNVGAAFIASVIPRVFLNESMPYAYPSSYVQEYQYTPGGGLFIVQWYALFGWVGVILLTTIFISVINNVHYGKGQNLSLKISYIFFVLMVVMFPRWVSYDFFNYLMRSFTILLISYALFKIFTKLRKSSLD